MKIKSLREKEGYTQQEISDLLHVERSTYAYYESGKTVPDLGVLVKLSQVFKVPLAQILDKEKKPFMFGDGGTTFRSPSLVQGSPKLAGNLPSPKSPGPGIKNQILFGTKSIIKKSPCEQRVASKGSQTLTTSQISPTQKPLSSVWELSDLERGMIVHFRMLSRAAQSQIDEVMSEKIKNSKANKRVVF